METNQDKSEINKQIKNAFEFMQKLYNEASYLIKEIEGQLSESEYQFQILRPSGYSISARSSTGLEQNNVNLWLLRKFSVAFVEESNTEIIKGQNVTQINEALKVLYFKLILDDKNYEEPKLLFGVLFDINKYKDHIKKFENLMGYFEYVDRRMFSNYPNIEYEDGTFKLKGKFKSVNLLDLNSSLELNKMVIKPLINIYKKI